MTSHRNPGASSWSRGWLVVAFFYCNYYICKPGLNPIETVTELHVAHVVDVDIGGAPGSAGVNVRRGRVTDMRDEHVLQPLHVTASALALATETVRAILKIDDIVSI